MTDPNMAPDYEVSLLLDSSKVLTAAHKLTDCIRSAFDVEPPVTMINVQFLDTNDKDVDSSHWSARIRKFENERKLELTYKRRYTITNSNINAALDVANKDGFNATNKDYEAQIEWDFQKKTLSISCKKKGPDVGIGHTDLPVESDSRQMLIGKAPDKFKEWKPYKSQPNKWPPKTWGTSALKESRIYGPVLMSRFTGSWNGLKLYLEVWPLRNSTGTGIEHFVEASFKTNSETTASVEQSNLVAFLKSKDWLLEQDSSMTKLIMARY
ncbi:hypothetical protein N7452_010246 [Penicillium brevicompactum]|uniref:Uncharacterized protein n=1 Tax=Penicillium brevicompactum TaxID=5074 RepID=A0A9W9UB13_PENBR|nr:hypothetical protein N7452_010246 [Penicillium brevicompactum]